MAEISDSFEMEYAEIEVKWDDLIKKVERNEELDLLEIMALRALHCWEKKREQRAR